MTKKIKRSVSFVTAFVMFMATLMYFPNGTLGNIEWGLRASAAESATTVTFTATDGTKGASTSEGYTMLFDGKYEEGNSTKWCVTNLYSSAYVIFDASDSILVTGYTIVTGNDNANSKGRNPKSWTLYGSLDTKAGRNSDTWVEIHSVTDDTTLENKNYTSYQYTIENTPTTAYQHFKLEITAIQSGSIMQMGEFIPSYNICEHIWEPTGETVYPTCTEGGYNVEKCSKCNAIRNVGDVSKPATGHDWVDGVTVAKTCTTDGYTPQTCSVCNATQKVNIVPASHSFEAGKCTVCGIIEPIKPSSGDGSEKTPYQISTAAELYWFAGLVNGDPTVCDYDAETGEGTKQNKGACAELTQDIVVNEGNVAGCGGTKGDGWVDWTPIGYNNSTSDACKYTGTFNGKNHTISGLYFSDNTANNVGLFGYNSGTVSNVGVENIYFSGKKQIGGICGTNSSKMENCYITNATIVGTYSYEQCIGGICGSASGEIKNCYITNATIIPAANMSKIGGVCGSASGTIANCYSTAKFTIPDSCSVMGGVCGSNNFATITNCYYLENGISGGINGVDATGSAEVKTEKQFASGEVAYLLQSAQVADAETGDIPQVWGQTLTANETYAVDALPVLSSDTAKKVYCNCGNIYSNTNSIGNHVYDNGICSCGEIEVPKLVDGYYKIANMGNLYWFAALVNGDTSMKDVTGPNTAACAKLTDDITVNSGVLGSNGNVVSNVSSFKLWTPMGNSETNAYTGTFDGAKGDGNNYTISGLYFDDTAVSNAGLFGYNKGTISNVTVTDSYFKAKDYVGGVCGYNNGGSITSCTNSSRSSKSSSNTGGGGVCGYNSGTIADCSNTGVLSGSYFGGVCGNNTGTIENCKNSGTLTGSEHIGGVCGYNSGIITDCSNTGTIGDPNFCSTTYLGGVCGENKNIIKRCSNIGTVAGKYYVGGVCGYNTHNISTVTIENCYNTGTVVGSAGGYSGSYTIGGVCGYGSSGKITSCYNTGTLTAKSDNITSYQIGDSRISIINCYYLAESESSSGGKTEAQFKSGEVAYLLQSAQTEDENGGIPQVWGQKLKVVNEGDVVDNFPVLSSDTVYRYCNGGTAGYSNTKGYQNHKYVNGFCVCGDYESADLNANGYYEISNGGQLYWFAQLVNSSTNASANAILKNDITVNAKVFEENGDLVGDTSALRQWTPIGSTTLKYAGTFNGDNYTISGLYLDTAEDWAGLFGSTIGTIKNVKVTNSYFKGNEYVGGICGLNHKGTIENCANSATVIGKIAKGSSRGIGGVCGYNNDGTITSCTNSGTVNGTIEYNATDYCVGVGGVCGFMCYNLVQYPKIKNCYNTGAVNGTINTNGSVGGVCGSYKAYSTATFENCYNTGAVTGTYNGSGIAADNLFVGGVCGYNYCKSNYGGTINNCYYLKTEEINKDILPVGNADDEESKGKIAENCQAESRNAEQFASGEVAHLLQGSQEEDVWGQTLVGKTTDLYPVFCDNNKVYKVTFNVADGESGSTVYAKKYANTAGIKNPPENPKSDNYAFAKWSTSNENFTDSAYDFDINTNAITGDTTVYAIGKKIVTNTTKNTGEILKVKKNAGVTDIDLNDYVKYNDDSAKNFTFSSESLPVGLTIGENGKINAAAVSIGRKSVTFDITDNAGLVLMSHSETASASSSLDELTLTFEVILPNGTGASEEPYIVSDLTELKELRDAVNGGLTYSGEYFKLDKDIDLNNEQWTPIGNNINKFEGNFDGKGHSITKLYIAGANDYQGLFGYIGTNGTVKNLGVDGYVKGGNYVGGVCGQNDGAITSCYSKVFALGTGGYVDKVCGNGNDTNCYYLETTANDKGGKTADQFASGEVCYLLNGENSDGDLAWGQTIGDDAYPVSKTNDNTVYRASGCEVYANTATKNHVHNAGGVCADCKKDLVPFSAVSSKLKNAWSKDVKDVVGGEDIGDETTVNVAVGSSLIDCAVKYDTSITNAYSYTIEILQGGKSVTGTEKSVYKKKSGICIDMAQIAYMLDNGTYTAKLTLFDEDGKEICTREMTFTVSDM